MLDVAYMCNKTRNKTVNNVLFISINFFLPTIEQPQIMHLAFVIVRKCNLSLLIHVDLQLQALRV